MLKTDRLLNYQRQFLIILFFHPGSGCSTAFIRMFAVMGLAKDLRTLESVTLQKALAEYARTKQPLDVCFKNALNNQVLPEEHYLKRD